MELSPSWDSTTSQNFMEPGVSDLLLKCNFVYEDITRVGCLLHVSRVMRSVDENAAS
jgi:hypothetical protein